MSTENMQAGPAQPVELSPELAEVMGAAQEVEAGQAGAAPVAPPDPAQVAQVEGQALAELIASLMLPVVGLRWPAIAQAYGPAEVQGIGAAFGAVAHKRGWNVGEVFGSWGPEIALCAACVAPALPVVLKQAADNKARAEQIERERAAQRVQQVQQAAEPIAAPAADPGQLGGADGRF